MYYVPWWLLAVCLPVAALAAYLALRGTDISRRSLYVLTVVLSPVLLLGAAVAAVVISTGLSAVLEPASQTPTQPARTGPGPTSPGPTPGPANPTPGPEATDPEATGPEATGPEATGPAASPNASPAASPSASPAASSASPAAGG